MWSEFTRTLRPTSHLCLRLAARCYKHATRAYERSIATRMSCLRPWSCTSPVLTWSKALQVTPGCSDQSPVLPPHQPTDPSPYTHTHPLSMLSRQQRQSLALHCIANGCQTISQERKEFCSVIHHVMVTWFNAVASDPWAKCDNWHYYHHHVFCCFFPVSFWSECSFWLCSVVTYLSVFLHCRPSPKERGMLCLQTLLVCKGLLNNV